MGILIAFTYGNYFSYSLSPFLLAIFPAVFLCVFVFMPESPIQLLKMNKLEEAERSLKFFRNVRGSKKQASEDLLAELDKLKEDFIDKNVDSSDDEKVTLADFSEYLVFIFRLLVACGASWQE